MLTLAFNISLLGHKSTEKNSVRNLQYGPKTRLIRDILYLNTKGTFLIFFFFQNMSTNPIISQIYILWRHRSLRYWKYSNVFFLAACVGDCITKHLFSKFYESPLFSALKEYQFSTVFPFKRNPVYELVLYAPFTHLPRKLRWVSPLFCSHFFTLLASPNDF